MAFCLSCDIALLKLHRLNLQVPPEDGDDHSAQEEHTEYHSSEDEHVEEEQSTDSDQEQEDVSSDDSDEDQPSSAVGFVAAMIPARAVAAVPPAGGTKKCVVCGATGQLCSHASLQGCSLDVQLKLGVRRISC